MHMAAREQALPPRARRMSSALWNLFTGSAPYRTIVTEAVHPSFFIQLARSLFVANKPPRMEIRHANDTGTTVP
jgi:hypothetical protein